MPDDNGAAAPPARLEELRALVDDALRGDCAATAVWYADKLATLSRGAVEDELRLARAYAAGGDPARAARLLEARLGAGPGAPPRPLVAQFRRGDRSSTAAPELRARLLAARCLARCGRHRECCETLEPALRDVAAADDGALPRAGGGPPAAAAAPVGVDLAAAACACVGAAYEALENRPRSVAWLVRALRLDAGCAEALDFVVDRRLLSADEEAWLRDETAAALENSDRAWVAAVYGARLGCRDADPAGDAARFEALDRVHGLGDNQEVLRARAERCYTAHDYRGAYEVARRVRERDPYDFGCAPVYLASLVELGAKHELFSTAHELAKAYPQKACSWFAVGCYYLLVKKNDQAQRHFHKACKLAPRFAPAWIGFGNAFAAQDESEQAMAAYRTASRLFQGSHVPLAYIGMEYLRTNNLPLAKHFLRGAKKLCASDPLVANELGVVEMRQGLLDDACRTFQEVLRLLERLPERAPLRRACAASVFNLAQCYRKRRRFEDAARAFGVALSLEPGDAAARGALGVALHALGGAHVHRAVECYHVALAMRPDDTFCSEMLSRALRDVASVDFDDAALLAEHRLAAARIDDDEDAAMA